MGRSYHADIIPANDVALLAKDDNAVLEGVRALWVGTAGTANITTLAGNDRNNFPLFAGMNQIRILKLRTGGTAANIWALY